MKQTVADIRQRLARADEEQYGVLERALAADTRKGIKQALAQARRRLDAEAAERVRTDGLYAFQRDLAGEVRRCDDAPSDGQVPAVETEAPWTMAVGLDEVGRGPIAGPLTIGAVVLPETPQIIGLNDSKQLTAAHREQLAREIRARALAWHIEHVPPAAIDERGMSACLHKAFAAAVAAIDAQMAREASDSSTGVPSPVRAVLIDGNPLHIDAREVSVVKGDAQVAAIAAASIIAKVDRDALMRNYAREYPGYAFESNKGYGSAEHIEAIGRLGLTPIHRKSFCMNFVQESLF